MSAYLELAKLGRYCGLEGTDIENFIKEHQDYKRAKKAAQIQSEREIQKIKREIKKGLKDRVIEKIKANIGNIKAQTKKIIAARKQKKAKLEKMKADIEGNILPMSQQRLKPTEL